MANAGKTGMPADGLGPMPQKAAATRLPLTLRLLNAGPVLILGLLIVIVSLLTPNFLKPINIGNILAQIAVIATVAIGQHIVILTRGIGESFIAKDVEAEKVLAFLEEECAS